MGERQEPVISVTNHDQRVHQLGPNFTLMVGLNPRVPQALWDKFKTGAVLKHYLRLGKRGGFVVRRRAVALADLKDKEAVAAVDDTWDRDVLRDWLASEKRPAVREAIAGRLEDMVTPDEKPDEDGDEKPRKSARAKAKAAGAEFVEAEE